MAAKPLRCTSCKVQFSFDNDAWVNQGGTQGVIGWGVPYGSKEHGIEWECEDYESTYDGIDWNSDYECSSCGYSTHRLDDLCEEVTWNYAIVDYDDKEFDTWDDLLADLEANWAEDDYIEIYRPDDSFVWDGEVGEIPSTDPKAVPIPNPTATQFGGVLATAGTTANVSIKLGPVAHTTTPLADEVLKSIRPVD